MIDLRSDTVTRPSPAMLQAMMNAKVGDDVYAEDPTVNELQETIADILGKEAAIFVPSGTMSNQIGVKVNTKPGDEVIIEKDAHIFYFETAAPAIISNVQLRQLPSNSGEMQLADIEEAIRPDVYYFPKTTCICLENTHNRHGGAILSHEYIQQVAAIAHGNNIAFHLDGARIWNASVATGVKIADYVKEFDTVSVCLSKGLGAPVGSVLAGTKEKITLARKWRKILGGGMRQAGIIAAAGLFAVKNNIERLAEDHANAKMFGKLLEDVDEIHIDQNAIATNMVVIQTKGELTSQNFVSACKSEGLLFNAIASDKIRIVFHLDISTKDTTEAANIIKSILKKH